MTKEATNPPSEYYYDYVTYFIDGSEYSDRNVVDNFDTAKMVTRDGVRVNPLIEHETCWDEAGNCYSYSREDAKKEEGMP